MLSAQALAERSLAQEALGQPDAEQLMAELREVRRTTKQLVEDINAIKDIQQDPRSAQGTNNVRAAAVGMWAEVVHAGSAPPSQPSYPSSYTNSSAGTATYAQQRQA